MLGLVFYQDAEHKGVMPTSTQTSIKVSVSIGAVIGMLVFGHLADRLGRRKMYGIELIIMVFATAAQAMIGMSSAISVIAIIISWRILLGIGIGGDYALSAVITAEFATTRWRGAMMGARISDFSSRLYGGLSIGGG
jgi:PHS family inorganic phosphate transporter-like MFS transporter